ncbi:MAG: methionyl-tRNA formyltransferase [Nitrospirae bacterium]|nr:methionyl-tRNA formyltransferase [Candidatus Manganitrophaceae bacterium]
MGTPDFALSSFQAIARTEDLIFLVTQPDRPKGRKGILTSPPVKEAALKLGIPIYQPERLRKATEVIDLLSAARPDLIVVVAFGQILPENVLNIPKYACINVHASLLPKYRGAGPIQWALSRGEKEIGVTTMLMDAGMDTGPMLLKKKISMDFDETAADLSPRLAEAGAELLIETLKSLKKGTLKAIPQNDTEASMAPLIKKEDGLVQWQMSAQDIFNRWRGFTPWPGLTTYYKKTRWKMTLIGLGATEGHFGVPGEIVRLSSKGLEIAAGAGYILLKTVQADGKRAMAAQVYAGGHPIEMGAVLST